MIGTHFRRLITQTNRSRSLTTSYPNAMFSGVSNIAKEQQSHQITHAAGVVGALMLISAIIALLPLDEFEKLDPENVCYHRHLHPR